MSPVWVMILVVYLHSGPQAMPTPALPCGVAAPAEFDTQRECEYALHMTLKRQAPKGVADGRFVAGFCQEVFR